MASVKRAAPKARAKKLDFLQSGDGGGVLRVGKQLVHLRELDIPEDHEGAFTKPYRDVDSGDVYAFTHANVLDKDAVAAAHARDPSNPHIPASEKLGYVNVRGVRSNVYKMPHYRVPPPWDSKATEEGALLGVCADNSARYRFGPPDTAKTLECARRDERVSPAVVRALELITEEAARRGEYIVEFPRKNLAVDDQGRLVLLDVIYPG